MHQRSQVLQVKKYRVNKERNVLRLLRYTVRTNPVSETVKKEKEIHAVKQCISRTHGKAWAV